MIIVITEQVQNTANPYSLVYNSSYFITAHFLSDWLCYSVAWHSLLIMACQCWSVQFCRTNPKTKILQLLSLSHFIRALQRRGVLHPLTFFSPGVTSRTVCAYFNYHLFINARYHLDPVGRDSAPRRRGFPTLAATAQPMVCQNCLTFTSLVWRTCYQAHLVASMALNGLRLISCFKRLIPHWRKILVPFNYVSVTLSELRTTSLVGVDHYWRTLCMHKGSLVIAPLASSHW
jgi:hypothetical protein